MPLQKCTCSCVAAPIVASAQSSSILIVCYVLVLLARIEPAHSMRPAGEAFPSSTHKHIVPGYYKAVLRDNE